MLAHAGGTDEAIGVAMLFAGLWIGWAGVSRLRGRGFPRLPIPAAYALIGLAVALAIGAAVIPRAVFAPSPAAVRPTTEASIVFEEPLADTVVTGGEILVVVDVTGGAVAGAGVDDPDAGHVHLSIDGRLVAMAYEPEMALPIADLAPGPHSVEAEYVASDHGPFSPRVVATVRFVKDQP